MDIMSPELQDQLIWSIILNHPLPWRIEQDWTVEVIDFKGNIVAKFMTFSAAEEIIEIAIKNYAEHLKILTELETLNTGV
jgi:hypothetical protein